MTPFNTQFASRLEVQFPQRSKAILSSFDQAPTLSVRKNPLKPSDSLHGKQIPWADTGVYLDERPTYALDPLYHVGAYYPQEASSMALEQVIKQISSNHQLDRVLDLCAAPGGKSTHLLQLISAEAVLISNEIVPKRFSILYENLIKWGYPNFIATNYRPDQFIRLGAIFDLVVIDAPCSGEGLFRKQEKWRDKWTLENCDLCAHRQQKILKTAMKLIRPGGYLIYSTCTLNPAENIDQVNYMLSNSEFEVIEIPALPTFNFDRIHQDEATGYLALPHQVKGEPFFITCLRHKGQPEPLVIPRTSRNRFRRPAPDVTYFSSNKSLARQDDDLYLINDLQHEMSECLEVMGLRHRMPKLGSYNKDLFIPGHFACMCPVINEYIMSAEVSMEDALKFLRHEQLTIELPNKGWYRLTFKDIGLGWIKYDGRRINNKYPIKWRLRLTK